MRILRRIYNYIKNRLYVNETLLLFQHKEMREIKMDVCIKTVTSENVKDLLNFQQKRYIDVFEHFLKCGDTGYYAYMNGKCVHRIWVVSNQRDVYLHNFISYKLKENEIFIHYGETAKWARGKNIFKQVLNKIIRDFNDRDILVCVNEKNISSINGVQKAGFIVKEKYHIVVLLGIKYLRKIG